VPDDSGNRGAAFGAVGAGPGDAEVGGEDVAAMATLPQPDSAMATEEMESSIEKPEGCRVEEGVEDETEPEGLKRKNL